MTNFSALHGKVIQGALVDQAFADLQTFAGAAIATGGTVSRMHADRFGVVVEVADFLTDAMIAANDCTAAINAALATGRSVRLLPSLMRVTSALNCTAHGQRVLGHGRTVSIILVDGGFNLSARGVFVAACGEPGPEFVDFCVEFGQPDTANFAALIAYPPAFLIDNTARSRFRDIRITRGYDGIQFLGNCGGATVLGLETSCLRRNVAIDGSVDSMRLVHWHCFPTGLGANNQVIFNSGNCYGLYSGRCDDLHLTDCLFLCGNDTAVYFYNSGVGPLQGATFGTLLGCDFDTNGGLQVADGNISVLGGELTLGDGRSHGILMSGGNLRVIGSWLTQAVASPDAIMVRQLGGIFSMSACELTNAPDSECIQVFNGQASIIGNQFIDALPAGDRARAKIELVNGTGSVTDNVFHSFAGGTRPGISMVGDLAYAICDNVMNGYSLAVTTTPIIGTFLNNIDAANDLGGYAVVGAIRTLVVENYAVDVNGNLVIPHGLGDAYRKVLQAQAFFRGGAGGVSAIPMPLVAVDGADAVFNGGVSGAPARAVIQYINQPQTGW